MLMCYEIQQRVAKQARIEAHNGRTQLKLFKHAWLFNNALIHGLNPACTYQRTARMAADEQH